ncbi:MAG: dehydrogenase [Acidobacteria bacterium]|nr:MAG: dehydrogenase [Acidobacteriota bacterium]
MAIQIGIMGGGNISQTHARAACAIPGVSIAAVYGTNASKVGRLCQAYGGTPYHDLDTFLKHRPMEFVAIGSPSGLHAAHGIAAAHRGLHVLTEKPIDISTQRAEELIQAAQQAGVKLGVIFQDRCKSEIQRLKQWVDGGILGKILLVDARVKWYRPPQYYGDSKWRGTLKLDGGGALINQAVHTIDLLLWLFGDVVRVQARIATALHAIEGEDTAVALLEFATGPLGVLQAATSAFPGFPRRLEITGVEGTVTLEHDRIVAVNLKNVPAGVVAGVRSDDNESTASPVVSDFRGHQAIFEDFIRAIQENKQPICNGPEGLRSIALIERIYRAAKL